MSNNTNPLAGHFRTPKLYTGLPSGGKFYGDDVLEIGTGWGSFSVHAARNYGCKIDTVTISDAQYDYAKSIIEKRGLASQINIYNKDYRKIEGKYEKIFNLYSKWYR